MRREGCVKAVSNLAARSPRAPQELPQSKKVIVLCGGSNGTHVLVADLARRADFEVRGGERERERGHGTRGVGGRSRPFLTLTTPMPPKPRHRGLHAGPFSRSARVARRGHVQVRLITRQPAAWRQQAVVCREQRFVSDYLPFPPLPTWWIEYAGRFGGQRARVYPRGCRVWLRLRSR